MLFEYSLRTSAVNFIDVTQSVREAVAKNGVTDGMAVVYCPHSAAHLKASAVGSSVAVIIDEGRLLLGTWQSVYFCEFDPPRGRKYFVKILGCKERLG